MGPTKGDTRSLENISPRPSNPKVLGAQEVQVELR